MTDAPSACCKLQARREIDSVALIQGLENIIYYTVVDCTVWCSTFAVEQRLHQLFRLQDNKYGLLYPMLQTVTAAAQRTAASMLAMDKSIFDH